MEEDEKEDWGRGGGEEGGCCFVKMTGSLPRDVDEDENANKAWRERLGTKSITKQNYYREWENEAR